jgi:hypothetical protein
MDFSYEQYKHQMNQIYISALNWPQPYHYQIWYQTLDESQQAVTLHPAYYTQIYTHAVASASLKPAQNIPKAVKPSRGQKRRMKK